MRSVEVDLGSRSYPVHIGSGLLAKLDEVFPKAEGAALVCDRTARSIHGAQVEEAMSRSFQRVHVVELESGEHLKTLERAEEILEELAKSRVRRDGIIVTLGGGVVSDVGGFVASVYLRGIRVVHIPTTLLAQVDAAIGGKTGVNLKAGKNLAGSFHQPSAVICDVATLRTLPQRELRSGMAEVAKYALAFRPEMISGIGPMTISDSLDDWESLVTQCVEIKAKVVAADPVDGGERMLLNYGHTLGHALEAHGDYSRWSHGEAIAIGMMFAAHLSSTLGLLDPEGVSEHERLLDLLSLPRAADFDIDEVTHLFSIDKKHRGGLNWVLLESLGEPVLRSGIDEETVRVALEKVGG